jgi:hypothetical protein
MLAEAGRREYRIHSDAALRLNGKGYGFQKGSPTEDESEKCRQQLSNKLAILLLVERL